MKKRVLSLLLAVALLAAVCAGCAKGTEDPKQTEATAEPTQAAGPTAQETQTARRFTDGNGRTVELPEQVERVVCCGVGALRYTVYLGAQDRVVGVEDYETKPGMARLYNYVNFDRFSTLPVIGGNGEPYVEQIIAVDPQVIVLSAYVQVDPDELQEKTGIPVVVVPGSDTTLDQKAFDTIRLLGELYGVEDRAEELTAYLSGLTQELADRTGSISEADKPSAYVAGVSFKGNHGFEGTEAGYGPFALIGAKNLADSTGQTGAFDVDLEQVLAWDPDVIFLDYNGMDLIREAYAEKPDYFNSLTAVQEGRVYAQISFRSYASNLDTALADAYYAASVLYPQAFADVNVEEKVGEIFTELLGSNPYPDLKAAGYVFGEISLAQ